MLVTRKMAEDAWATLRTHARVVNEEWDADHMAALPTEENIVKRAFHAASRTTHPDTGGTVEQFVPVDRAKHVLVAWLARAAAAVDRPQHGGGACPTCGGTGSLLRAIGFRRTRVVCPGCRGNGEMGVEQEKNS